MLRTRLALLLMLLAVPAHAGGRVEFRSFRPPSLGGAKKDCRVYLPASYDLPDAHERRYPVVVFLHGWPGSEGNWPGQGRAIETNWATSFVCPVLRAAVVKDPCVAEKIHVRAGEPQLRWDEAHGAAPGDLDKETR